MNIQEIINMLVTWHEHNGNAIWTLSQNRNGLNLMLGCRHNSRKVTFSGMRYDFPNERTLATACEYVIG